MRLEVLEITNPRLHAPKALVNDDESEPLTLSSAFQMHLYKKQDKWHAVSFPFDSTESAYIKELRICVGRDCVGMRQHVKAC